MHHTFPSISQTIDTSFPPAGKPYLTGQLDTGPVAQDTQALRTPPYPETDKIKQGMNGLHFLKNLQEFAIVQKEMGKHVMFNILSPHTPFLFCPTPTKRTLNPPGFALKPIKHCIP